MTDELLQLVNTKNDLCVDWKENSKTRIQDRIIYTIWIYLIAWQDIYSVLLIRMSIQDELTYKSYYSMAPPYLCELINKKESHVYSLGN